MLLEKEKQRRTQKCSVIMCTFSQQLKKRQGIIFNWACKIFRYSKIKKWNSVLWVLDYAKKNIHRLTKENF